MNSKVSYNTILEHDEIGAQIKLQATIAEQLFYNEETTYGVYRIASTQSKKATCLLSGYFPYPLLQKTIYHIHGTVSLFKDEKQIKLETIYMMMPTTDEDIIRALQVLKGINKQAHALVSLYSLNTITFMIDHPEQVAKDIKGISVDLAKKISIELQLRYAQVELREQLKVWGFTQKQAEAIVQKFGQSALLIIRNNPYDLIEHIHGIGFKTIDKIALQFGVSSLSEARVNAAIRYCLAEATQQGHCYMHRSNLVHKLTALISVRLTPFECAAILSKLNKKRVISYERDGATYKLNAKDLMLFMERFDREQDDNKREQLFYTVEGYTTTELNVFVDKLAEEQRIILHDERVYLVEYYNAELKLAYKVIKLLLFEGQQLDHQPAIKQVLKKGNYKLEQKQLEAVTSFTEHEGGFMILNGSAGCGKTFTLNVILEVMEDIYIKQGRQFNVQIMAPTGKAAQVASIATGRTATTIHRGLRWKGDGGFQFNEQEPLPCDCLVIDESSMLDLRLAHQLSKAIKENCKVIFMGDTKQLQSVGAGNVLHDLIATGLVPIVTLDVIKRQDKDSGIIDNARRIMNEQMIVSEKEKGDSFFIESTAAIQTLQLMIKGIQRLIDTRGYTINDIQVLTPMRKGELGVDCLNYELQRAFNTNRNSEHSYFNKSFTVNADSMMENEQRLELHFYVGDKVIHLVNDYTMPWYSYRAGEYASLDKLGITNGECGVITDIKILPSLHTQEQVRVTVKYDEGYVHYINPGKELDHCYAMTIHKSQGSQWPAVFMPIAREQRNMLNNSLVYTGFTRAKQFQCVIGDKFALERAIKHNTMESRLTSLRERFVV